MREVCRGCFTRNILSYASREHNEIVSLHCTPQEVLNDHNVLQATMFRRLANPRFLECEFCNILCCFYPPNATFMIQVLKCCFTFLVFIVHFSHAFSNMLQDCMLERDHRPLS